MSKFTGALCSELSVKQLIERQFSTSIAESFDRRLFRDCGEPVPPSDPTFGNSSLIAPGADELRFLLDSKPLFKTMR